MNLIKNYWFLIIFSIGLIGSTAVAQYRLDLTEKKVNAIPQYVDKQRARIIQIVRNEAESIKRKAEQDYSEAKKEIEKIKSKQEAQTVLQVNQRYIREDMKELKGLVKDLANEIRRTK